MKFLIGILVVGILTMLLGSILPWWSIGLAGLIGGIFFGESGFKSFLIAFFGTGLCWLLLTVYINQMNGGLLSSKIAELFNGIPPIALILITTIIGGLASGVSSLTGYFGRKSFGSK